MLVVRGNPVVANLDGAGHRAVRAFGRDHPAWLSALSVLTHVGSTAVVGAATAAGVVVMLRTGRRADALFVATASVAAYVCSRVLRTVIGRPRPEDRSWVVEGASFPSGHTANAAAAAMIVTLVCWPLVSATARGIIVTAAATYTAVIALSRVAGGVHWPTDVVGSVILSVACVTTTGAFLLRRRVWRMPSTGA